MRWTMPRGEWLETDGLGGFASSTVLGIHTRRYHGWLFLAGKDPGDRSLYLSKLEDSLETGEGVFDLSSNQYPGCIYPHGVKNLINFSVYPFPTFTFKVGRGILTREIFMVKYMPGVFCVYRLHKGSPDALLVISPLMNFRFYHYLSREGSFDLKAYKQENGVLVGGYPGAENIFIAGRGLQFTEDPVWYRNMLYREEEKRGLDYCEDHFCPGKLRVRLRPGVPLVIWIGPVYDGKISVKSKGSQETKRILLSYRDFASCLPEIGLELRAMELGRREGILENVGKSLSLGSRPKEKILENSKMSSCIHGEREKILGQLFLAGDQFIISTGEEFSIIAGYHWFGEWGRDAFISLPGLLLTTERFDEARKVFMRFSKAISKGLIPNTFWEGRGAAYNSVDASLWYIHALAKYEKASNDGAFIKGLIPVVCHIVDSFIKGTENDIKMAPCGLLTAGNASTQVTWMDACVNGEPVTPRNGFPVEVNALWIESLYHLSVWLQRFAPDMGPAHDYARLAAAARREFLEKFVWPEKGLYDCIGPDGPVKEVRPNQVIAASVESLNLPEDVLKKVFYTSLHELLTPFGLRTLSRSSKDYKGSYSGGPAERDHAYHQGSSWPFLLGPLFDLARIIGNRYSFDFDYAGLFMNILGNLLPLDKNPCICSIFELTSGDFPYEKGGTVAQAWSVAEILRILSDLVRRQWFNTIF